MISGLVGSVLLRQVPEALLAGVQSGEFQVFGSIIRSRITNRIVGHLQEAGGLSQLAGSFGANPLNILMQGVQVVQNEQIKAGVRHIATGVEMLQQLGVANLAFGAAGIGVSAVGFAVIAKKIDHVKRAVENIGEKVDQLGLRLNDIRQDLVAADLDDLRALAWSMDEAWKLGDAAAERRWQEVSGGALKLTARFERHAGRLLGEGIGAVTTAQPMLDGLGLAGSLRVASLAAAGETRAARDAAYESARAIEAITGRIGQADLTRTLLAREQAAPGTPEWGYALKRAAEAAREDVDRLRDREAAAATRGAPLVTLAAKNISARDWLAAARNDNESPLLFMMAAEA